VPSNELLACDLYEYARESRAVILTVTDIRRQQAQAAGKSQQLLMVGATGQSSVRSHLMMTLVNALGFPKSPWKIISEKDRHLVLKYMTVLPHIFRYDATCIGVFSFADSGEELLCITDICFTAHGISF